MRHYTSRYLDLGNWHPQPLILGSTQRLGQNHELGNPIDMVADVTLTNSDALS